MKIVVGSDHAGLALKLEVAEALRKEGHAGLDVGAHSTAAVARGHVEQMAQKPRASDSR